MILWGASRNIEPDLSSDGGYETGQSFGHPLWEE